MTQTAGRAARNVNGMVIMYADRITESMQLTINETNRRREKQLKYNEEHGITPQQIKKAANLNVFTVAAEGSDTSKTAAPHRVIRFLQALPAPMWNKRQARIWQQILSFSI